MTSRERLSMAWGAQNDVEVAPPVTTGSLKSNAVGRISRISRVRGHANASSEQAFRSFRVSQLATRA